VHQARGRRGLPIVDAHSGDAGASPTTPKE
jgi:hypothetical protein